MATNLSKLILVYLSLTRLKLRRFYLVKIWSRYYKYIKFPFMFWLYKSAAEDYRNMNQWVFMIVPLILLPDGINFLFTLLFPGEYLFRLLVFIFVVILSVVTYRKYFEFGRDIYLNAIVDAKIDLYFQSQEEVSVPPVQQG